MKKILLFVFLLTACFSYSQNDTPITVKGKLIDKNTGTPLEFATVSFISKNPQKAPQGGVTDLEGNYSISITPGTYTVKWEYITFKSVVRENQTITEDKDYGTISLEVDVAELDAAIVIAEKTTVDIRLDKKIYNIGKDLTVRGGSASDVLDNVPSVSVDVEGNVALRGNDNVTIFIDGRPSALVGLDGADALRQIPAETIEKIEVITSPSARYDAEGTAGILNIILRKESQRGFNGNLQLESGIPERLGLSFNGNYRKNKWNLFTNTGWRYRTTPGNARSDTEFNSPDAQNKFVNERRVFDRLGRSLFTSLGAQYDINQKSNIIANAVYRYGNDDDITTNTIDRFDENLNLNEATRRIENEGENEDDVQFTLDYKNDLDDNGQKLTASIQYGFEIEQELANITETETTTNTLNDLEFSDQNTDERNALVQIDYELPIGENINWEAGYRGNYRDITTSFFLAERDFETSNTDLIPDAGLNNTFNYEELIHATYVQYGRKINNFSFLTGLRYEYTDVNIFQATTNETANKNYHSLFPTVNMSYEIKQGENLTLGYNRRIRRPRGRSLNPFPSRSSESNIFQGNVDLDPTFTNSVELGYIKRWTKFTLSTAAYMNISDDNWERIQQVVVDENNNPILTDNGDPIIRRFPVNLSKERRIGYELTLTYRPFKWWTINSDFNVFNVDTDGAFEDQDFTFNNTTYFARLNQKITLPAEIDFQTRLNYRGASENAQGTNDGIATLNLAASKDVFGENATITASVSDVFNSRRRESTTIGPDIIVDGQIQPSFISDSAFQWRERQFIVTFVYRFNEKKKRERGERSGDNDGDDGFEG
ncbi:outer membrane receptor protein involved in Fe transport [Nonlabens dokdonensis]|uniref:TonB-dependent outer membrane receptor n=2 Tax=Nonlabens dokdonensis TaxID=328515 RepID=L7WGQ9_NONDD|nr:TonB-dependent receptor [Nonlabens dokdonensis]AGC78128.1 TonB-dependent outer membrane receptor [Nonlabens dokdonensis DSW-6]PZX37189.1 outer membrane receptor protein involved in Fe transport [Nonlabens dokdonensis]